MPFNKCFVHATRGGAAENVEEVTIPVLSRLDDMWCDYSTRFIRRMAGSPQPWLLYHCTRGAHFDNYPLERFLGSSPARHPYKDTLVELDDIVGRLVRELEATGQLEHTLIVLTSDNGPHMETWPDAAYTPFRSAKGSTWEGGVRVPALFVWPGMIDADRVSDGLMSFSDLLPTAMTLAGAPERVPTDRYVDGIDQTSFLLAPDGTSCRKYHYYWLVDTFSGLRVGEYKWLLSSTSDDETDVHGTGGFTGVTQRYTYPRLFNLYLDPKESKSYLTRKLAYLEVLREGMRDHLATFQAYPPKKVMGLGAAARPAPGVARTGSPRREESPWRNISKGPSSSSARTHRPSSPRAGASSGWPGRSQRSTATARIFPATSRRRPTACSRSWTRRSSESVERSRTSSR